MIELKDFINLQNPLKNGKSLCYNKAYHDVTVSTSMVRVLSQTLEDLPFWRSTLPKTGGFVWGEKSYDLFPDLYHLFISFLFTYELVHLLNDLFDCVHLCTLLCRYLFDHWFTRSFSHLVMIFFLDYFLHCFRLDAFTLLHISLYMPPSVTHVLICLPTCRFIYVSSYTCPNSLIL